MTDILLIYCQLHMMEKIHAIFLCVLKFPSDCKRRKEENKRSKKVSAWKGRNLLTFQTNAFRTRVPQVIKYICVM